MKTGTWLVAVLLSGACCVHGAEYGVAKLDEAPPSAGLAKEIHAQLNTTGVRVTRDGAPFCDIWLGKSLASVSGFKASPELNYPFTPGQLIGVARVARQGTDFRNQDIRPGLYTMRYAQQPVDGAHVGTSPTRDFLLLISAAQDKSPEVLDYKLLTKQSAEAAQTSHPAIMSLQPAMAASGDAPSIRKEDRHEWWIMTHRATVQSGGAATPLPIALVVAGAAPEM